MDFNSMVYSATMNLPFSTTMMDCGMGIYVVEFSDPSKRFSSYGDVHKAVDHDKSPKPKLRPK